MTSTQLNYRDLYEAINQLRQENNACQAEIAHKLEAFIKDEYMPLKDKVNQMWIWGTISVGLTSLLANTVMPIVVKALTTK